MKTSEIKNKEPYIEITINRREAQKILNDLEFFKFYCEENPESYKHSQELNFLYAILGKFERELK